MEYFFFWRFGDLKKRIAHLNLDLCGAPFWFKTFYSLNIYIFFLLIGLSDEQREQVQKCLKSRRVIQEDEILRLSKQVSEIACQ